MIKKKVISSILAFSLLGCVSASAKTYLSGTLTGQSARSSMQYLGSGNRTLHVRGVAGEGYGSVKKVVAWAPDKSVASVHVNYRTSNAQNFQSSAYTSNGKDVQSYYMYWSGLTNKASAAMSING
ncbi:hypothetical protein [Clostridium botulinum]|uniref:hypothetical protein n=1 Tax=Clostridium botulinum TaxID=1491 RepID=UPI0004D9BB86|nr:hypothetical protein [Clostridium botulinum]KEH90381.1 hypothetical protein Z963_p0080 [Clostridium botulinum C/D str. It1]